MWAKFQWFLDWLGRVQTALWIVGLTGVTVSGIAALLQASPLSILGFILSGCLVGLGCLIAWQNYHSDKPKTAEAIVKVRDNTSPLKINFSGEMSQSEFIEEPAQIGTDRVSRRIFWVNIYNDSGKDIKNARGEMSSIKILSSDGIEEDHPLFRGKTFPLTFPGGNQVLDFSPHMNARLPLLSHASHFLPGFIRIEGHERPFMHESKLWKVKVTADGYLPVERAFTTTAADGLLDMKAVD